MLPIYLDVNQDGVLIGDDPGAADDAPSPVAQEPPVVLVAADSRRALAEVAELTKQRHGGKAIEPAVDLARNIEARIGLVDRLLGVRILPSGQSGGRMCPCDMVWEEGLGTRLASASDRASALRLPHLA